MGGIFLKYIVQLDNIGMKYQSPNGEIPAISNINLNVTKGEFIAIVGPSGCGKSTLLSIICGLIQPTSGNVLINGKLSFGNTSEVGYMLQKDYLFEWRTILQNIYLGLEIKKALNPENINYVESLLKAYGLYEFRYKYPSQLSGGMKQRAALIRTLALKPEILLLDEAFSALDYQTRLAVSEDIYSIIKKENKTAIMVTHDVSEAISMADRVVVLTSRPAIVRNIHDILLTVENRTPLSSRKAPEFKTYYEEILKELDIHV